jgi:hypothetical protein
MIEKHPQIVEALPPRRMSEGKDLRAYAAQE